MYKSNILVLALVSLITGCSTLNESTPSPALNTKVTADFSADIEVGNVTKGSSQTTIILGIPFGDTKYANGVNYGASGSIFDGIYGYNQVELAKSAAAYNALKKMSADILIAPRYTVDEFNFFYLFRTIDVDVTGYSGSIKSVKQK
jgi:hypothetical protein